MPRPYPTELKLGGCRIKFLQVTLMPYTKVKYGPPYLIQPHVLLATQHIYFCGHQESQVTAGTRTTEISVA